LKINSITQAVDVGERAEMLAGNKGDNFRLTHLGLIMYYNSPLFLEYFLNAFVKRSISY